MDSEWAEPASLGGQFIGSALPQSCYGNYKRGCSAGIYGTDMSLGEIMKGEQERNQLKHNAMWEETTQCVFFLKR